MGRGRRFQTTNWPLHRALRLALGRPNNALSGCSRGSYYVSSRDEISPSRGAEKANLLPNENVIFQDVNVGSSGVTHLFQCAVNMESGVFVVSRYLNYRARKCL